MIGGPQSEFLTDWAEGMGMKIFNMKQNNRKIKTKKRERKEGIKKKKKKKKPQTHKPTLWNKSRNLRNQNGLQWEGTKDKTQSPGNILLLVIP